MAHIPKWQRNYMVASGYASRHRLEETYVGFMTCWGGTRTVSVHLEAETVGYPTLRTEAVSVELPCGDPVDAGVPDTGALDATSPDASDEDVSNEDAPARRERDQGCRGVEPGALAWISLPAAWCLGRRNRSRSRRPRPR